MNPQLNADMVALKAANQRAKMSMGAERFRAAEAALAAEKGARGAKSLPPVANPVERQDAAASSNFTASERADMALLRKARIAAGGIGEDDATAVAGADWEESLTAQERADVVLLRAAGVIKP